MKYYTDGFMMKSNPSPYGGGYTITDETGAVLHQEVIRKAGLTNNEAETMGILHALRIAETGDTVSTDSMCCLTWVNRGRAKARKDLFDVLDEAKALLRYKKINLMWEGRDFNLAGIHNENNLKKYDLNGTLFKVVGNQKGTMD